VWFMVGGLGRARAWGVRRGGQAKDEAGVGLPAAARRQHGLLAPV
jgi:hypothetical protein